MDSDILASPSSSADFTITALFLDATLTVQLVMIILLLASIWAWAVIIQKHISYGFTRRSVRKFNRLFWSSGQSLEQIAERIGTKARFGCEEIFMTGMKEWQQSQKITNAPGASPADRVLNGTSDRIARLVDIAVIQEADKLRNSLGVLATVGSTAPFIGLFGTVWGIKNAFQQIAATQNTSLGIVAPGIAEALVATALGLLAAIPAVIFYNKLSRDADRISTQYEAFADRFVAILSRQLDN